MRAKPTPAQRRLLELALTGASIRRHQYEAFALVGGTKHPLWRVTVDLCREAGWLNADYEITERGRGVLQAPVSTVKKKPEKKLVTVRLAKEDVELLKSIAPNASEAVRSLIEKARKT